MNSLGHLLISIGKSIIRMVSCIWAIVSDTVLPIGIGFLVAEILGKLEELVDKRQ